jgi:hypothetical protein
MEVSGQLHAPATLPPGKSSQVPIGWEAEWAQAVHPVAHGSTNWAIPTATKEEIMIYASFLIMVKEISQVCSGHNI